MQTYIYDGSFQGFLTSVYDGIANNENPEKIIIEEKYEPGLFEDKNFIFTDPKKAEKVIKILSQKFGLDLIKNIYYSYLSCESDIEKKIFDYIKFSFLKGKNVDGFYSNDFILIIQNAVKKVSMEKQKFIGIIRFKLLKDGIYYSSIEPDNNITALLITHFKKRYSTDKWLIHDIKRNIGAYHDGKNASIINIDSFEKKLIEKSDNPDGNIFDENEIQFQKLWKTYFQKISITERKNPRLQRQFIPIRYWKHLIEKE